MRKLCLVGLTILLATQSASGEESLQVRQGRAFAQRICATCHGVVLGALSPAAGAPNFYTLASTPGMSELALRVALQTPHHSMPNLMLTADEMRDVTAYIISLRPN